MSFGAIITADIVNSTSLPRRQEKKLLETLHLLLKPYKYEFYRGDSFQVHVKNPGDALKLLLQLRLAGKKITADRSGLQYDIRASIGIGDTASPKSLRTATGEAFILSGRAFDEIGTTGVRLVIQSPGATVNAGLKVIANFIDYIFQKLTQKQAIVVYELLLGNTQEYIAGKLKKSQPTIHKHAQSSGWPQIAELLKDYQQLINLL